MIKHILYTTDFSESSAQAFPYALDLAQKHNAKLHILNVFTVPLGAPSSMFTSSQQTMKRMHEEKYALSRNNLQKYFSEYLLSDMDWVHHSVEGEAHEQILKYQEANDVDLTVMGTHGSTSNLNLFMGSVASVIVRRSKSPVLIIPPLVNYIYPNKLVYATDLKGNDSKTINYVVDLAERYYSNVSIVHVGSQADLQEENKLKLKSIASELNYSMVDFYDIVESDVAKGLLNFIDEHQGDWLAMTTHTTSIFDRLFHSSLTTKMLNRSPIPILVFNQFKSDIIVL